MPFALLFHKEIPPHPCHYPPSTMRAGTPTLPSMPSHVPFSAYLPLLGWDSLSWAGNQSSPRKTAEDGVGKPKSALLESVGERMEMAESKEGGVEKSPLRALKQA